MHDLHMAAPSCLIPRFDGAILSLEWKEALWDKFVPAAPRPRTLNNLAFDMQPDARRNQEWQLPDPTIGYRKMDGFAALPCMLIEAKLGYAGYLIERFVVRDEGERTDPVPLDATSPIIDDDNWKGARIMDNFMTQMRNQNILARQYPAKPGSPTHTVAWCLSNLTTTAFCYAQIRSNGLERLKSFFVPAGMLPPSRWTVR